MSRINQLREQRTSLSKEVHNLLEQNPGAKWKANAQNQIDYDGKMATIEDCDAEIKRLQASADLDADTRFSEAVVEVEASAGRKPSEFSNFLRGGFEALTADQVKANRIRNTMSTTTSGQGGYTVQTTVVATLVDAMKAFGGMRMAAEVFTTSQGNDMQWPGSDGTSEVGEIIAQNTTATAADPSFTSVTISVYKFSSKIVAVPFELLQDSVLDIEAFVTKRLATRIGRIQNTKFTLGSGTAEPNGVVTAASSGKVGTTGQTLTVIYDDIIDLEHSIDPAYRVNCKFMMADSSLKVIRKLKDGNARPLFLPSYDASIAQGAPSQLAGYPIEINQDVAVMAANAKSILFGDFSFYKIRDVMDVTMFRFTDSAYTKLGQVGFLAWARSGGNMVDPNAVKYYTNSAT